ncbi:MAG: phosphoenolpyruvate--protein phosphotransferase [Proteobacteria bacterium]|nr:phosphoenolpyruvate--protein phosphotransferase [Pseudomonadota bacterium]
MRQLRDIMAGPGSAQARLDQIAILIARELVAEVCSIYVRRAGDVLELFATKGLRPDAVRHTRLMVGEGLVGFVAAQAMPVALADARSHPLFAYRPETGEELYSSLMGVPVLRGGRVLGVLVVQNRTQRSYTDEEVETLETTAMVLAEMIAGSGILNLDEARYDAVTEALPQRLEGLALSPGLTIGIAVVQRQRVTIERMLSDNPMAEEQRVRDALTGMHGQLDAALERTEFSGTGEHRDVLETFRMFAEDRGWLRRIDEAIRSGLSAEAAVQRVQDETRVRMGQVTDSFLRERLLDFEELTDRLLRQLVDGGPDTGFQLPPEAVLVARTLGPAELLNYEPENLKAVLLEEGSANAHATIVARALGIPLVGRLEGLLSRVETGDSVLVDGENGVAYLRPGDEVRANFEMAVAARSARLQSYRVLRDMASETRDGVPVSLFLNAGLLADMNHLRETGADGVGLYRTEIPFMTRATYPDVEAQTDFYARVLDEAGGRPVTFRTLDIGGDKALPYLHNATEENPAMGWRATRIALDRPVMMRHQLRALIVASAGRDLSVMFPMIAQVSEFVAAKRLLDIELARAPHRGEPIPAIIRVGVMLEVPALAMQFENLLPRVDFLSVGSNDLVQFLFASDRGNPRMEGRYDTLSPAVLNFLKRIAEDCDARRVDLTVCGEMAGDPVAAMALIGIGYRRLSMSPANIGPVKAMIRSMSVDGMAGYLEGMLHAPHPSIRSHLRGFARDHGVEV